MILVMREQEAFCHYVKENLLLRSVHNLFLSLFVLERGPAVILFWVPCLEETTRVIYFFN